MPAQNDALQQMGSPFEWPEVLTKYLDWMRVTHYSADTIHVRGLYLKYFMAWAQERGITGPGEVTPGILERYKRWLYHYRKKSDAPLSVWSQHGRLVAIKGLFRWLARQRIIPYNPASELELPRIAGKRLPRPLTAHEAEEVLAHPDVSSPLGLRDRALLETLYSNGIRRMELIRLTRYDLDLVQGTVLIREGKGKKDRVVPIGARACAWIEKYLEEARPHLVREPDPGIVFLSHFGSAFTPNHLSYLVRRYINKASIGKRGACHLFRHTMATVMLEHGADIRYIQEMLGHARLTTTQQYTGVSIRKLKEVHTETHPAAVLERKAMDTDEEE